MPLLRLLLLSFAGGVIAVRLPPHPRNLASLWTARVALAAALCHHEVADGGATRKRLPWLPSLGVDIVVHLDPCAHAGSPPLPNRRQEERGRNFHIVGADRGRINVIIAPAIE